tara:strand:+ start:623 stop:1408 length:786 start_codon:yes stop_codon:yes gene_type:complete
LAAEPAPGVVLLGDGTPIIHEPSDWTCRGSYEGTYEREVLRLLPDLLHEGDVCVDVGANIGIFSARVARLVGETGVVVAVEPSPRCQADLELVVGNSANVTMVRAALGRTTDTVQLSGWDNPDHRGLGTAVPGHRAGLEEHWFDGQTVDVPQLRLADVIDEHVGDREIGLLKVDVEGYEPEVLAGAPDLFADRRVRAAILEVTPDVDSSWAVDLLSTVEGYEAFAIGETGTMIRRTDLVEVNAGMAAERTVQWNLLLRRLV